MRHGVFEEEESLDVRYAQKALRSVHCRSGSAGGTLEKFDWGNIGFSSRNDFCKSNEQAALSLMLKHDRGRYASKTLAEAWSACMKQEPTGFVETFHVPKDRPEIVRYQVRYNPGGAAPDVRARVTGFHTDNLTGCQLQVGEFLGRGAKTLLCRRIDPCRSATITLNTDQGSPNSLPASEVPAPPDQFVLVVLSEKDPPPVGMPADAPKTCVMHCRGERTSSGAPHGDCVNGPIVKTSVNEIFFGKWSNPQCGPSGEGWYAAPVGSCGIGGGGSKPKRCDRVEVGYFEPPKGCAAKSDNLANVKLLGR